MKKLEAGGFVDLDPAVMALVDRDAAARAERALPAKERKARAAARRKVAKRTRVMLDLPDEITAWLKDEAAALGVTASQVAGVLLARGMEDVLAGELDLARMREVSLGSRRYDYRLVVQAPDRDTAINPKGHRLKKARDTA